VSPVTLSESAEEGRGPRHLRVLMLAWTVVLGAVAGLVVYAGVSGDPPALPPNAPTAVKIDLPPRPGQAAAPTAPAAAAPVVDLGLDAAVTETAIRRLPGEVTLAFSPYADDLDRWVALARSIGHEVLLLVPMESANVAVADPGPHALMTDLTPAQNLERLDWALRRAAGYVGVMPYHGDRFIASEAALRPTLEAIKARGLLFFDPRSTQRSQAGRLAGELGLPRVIADGAVDDTLGREAIDARLTDMVAQARRSGVAVATVAPTPNAIDRLALWLPSAEIRGVAVAPISAVLGRQSPR